MVTIIACIDLSMAYIARSKLESCGIRAFLSNEYIVGIQPLYANALHGVALMVEAADAEAALELLRDDFGPEELLPEDKALAPDLETALFEPAAVCPECGDASPRGLKVSRLLLFFTWLTGIPARTRKHRYQCLKCGHTWWTADGRTRT